jgi:MFS family permease
MSANDSLARRNAIVLAGAHALAGANASVVIATGALVGQALAPSPDWATLPITTFVLGTALATLPAAAMMRELGRRDSYRIGAGFGVVAGLLAAYAVREAWFTLFLLATALCGAYQAFVVSYRFGATDNASPAFRPRAISYVLLGGLASAIVGPQLVIHTKDLTPPITFLASYVGQALFAGAALLLLGLTRFPAAAASDAGAAPARPLREILAAPRLRVAIACGAVAQALMNLIMTATPLAMVGCGLTATEATLAIQWHIIGMFAPGFFTGGLINRFGTYPVMLLGLALLASCGVVALAGISVEHFFVALILLGLGWNFAFVGASALIAADQRPAERTKVQGVNDLIIFSVTAAASLSAGKILAGFGWSALNLTLFPFVLAAALLVLWLARVERRPAREAAE